MFSDTSMLKLVARRLLSFRSHSVEFPKTKRGSMSDLFFLPLQNGPARIPHGLKP
jgi:hypothetical protein